MRATLYFHVRHEDNCPITIKAKEATNKHDSPYYEFSIGDLIMFLDNAQCHKIMDVLGSRPNLPKSDAEIDAEKEI
jgi:hypothetical protein